eukprot:m51a1_g7240 hypothetical protein (358) ;mRNA; f:105407-106922
MGCLRWAVPLALACLASCLLASPQDECSGAESVAYDSGDDYTLTGESAYDNVEQLCGHLGQLLVPPAVPWAVTRVCFALWLSPLRNPQVPLTATVRGAVSLHPVAVDPILGPADRTSYATFARELAPTWVSVDVSGLANPMVIWEKGAVVAVSFWSCGNVTLVGTRTPDKARRLTYKFKPKKAYWVYYDGTGAFAFAPQATTTAKYNDGNCDCNCGAGDVDCLRNFTSDCGPGHVCDQTGRCVEVDWEERGLCNASNYWQYDGCQCECGNTFDPDCWDVCTPVSVCAEALVNPFCSAPKMGQRSFCDAVWKCDSAEYEDGKICNCNCGTQDPDCYDHSLNTTCPGNWLCFEGKCAGT